MKHNFFLQIMIDLEDMIWLLIDAVYDMKKKA